MNRTALTLAAALTASLLSTTALAQGKVGVINLTKVFDDFWRTKQADGQPGAGQTRKAQGRGGHEGNGGAGVRHSGRKA